MRFEKVIFVNSQGNGPEQLERRRAFNRNGKAAGKSGFGGQDQKLIGDIYVRCWMCLRHPRAWLGLGSGLETSLSMKAVIRLRTESDLASWKPRAANRSSFGAMGVKHQSAVAP